MGEICFVLDTCVNNLRYARLDVPEAECIEVAKRANAQEFILRLPDGCNTVLTERGSNLSQGQRQLLTIALRANLKGLCILHNCY